MLKEMQYFKDILNNRKVSAQDLGYTYIDPQEAISKGYTPVEASWEPTEAPAVIRQRSYDSINAEYSGKVREQAIKLTTAGVPTINHASLLAIREEWKKAILEVAGG
nr:hypothetical protein [uncultured Anaeromusa sp.]